jgi:chromosome segregation ATPase
MTEDLSDLSGPLRGELTRLRAERVVFVAERERLLAQLSEVDISLRAVLADRDRLLAEYSDEHVDQAVREATSTLRAELASARAERDALRAELAATRARRDDLRLRLLDAELLLAGKAPVAAPLPRRATSDEIHAARQQIEALAGELAATRATVSWRVTAPLRAVRKKTRQP